MLLEACALDVRLLKQEGDETWPQLPTPIEVMEELARIKLRGAVEPKDELPLVVADTAVWLHGEPLGKPVDADDAFRMLRALSGSCHHVLSSVGVAYRGAGTIVVVNTSIWFRKLSEAAIERYVKSGESMDKAGAYGIQGEAGAFVDRVEGSYSNVVGLPVAETLKALESLGWTR
jgi:septum formation protein